MAIGLNQTLSTGVQIQYWRITNLRMNMDAQTCQVQLSGYITQAGRESGDDPASSMSLTCVLPPKATLMASENVLAAIYTSIMTLPELSGCTAIIS